MHSPSQVAPHTGAVIVLGASGFVGSQLVPYLRDAFPSRPVSGLSSHDVNLTATDAAVALASRFTADTTVIMCSGIKSNYGNDHATCMQNITMASELCKAVLESPIRRLIFLSSVAVYGVDSDNAAISEDTPVVDDTYYGLSKSVSETLFTLAAARQPQMRVLNLRIPTIYGHGERIRAATPSGFLTTCMAGDEVVIWGDGSEYREFLYIKDLLRILEMLIDSEVSGVLNPSNGKGYSYREALEIIAELLGRDLAIRSRERTKPQVDKVYDGVRFGACFPAFTFTTLREGLTEMHALAAAGATG